jgi:hypothetical protein
MDTARKIALIGTMVAIFGIGMITSTIVAADDVVGDQGTIRAKPPVDPNILGGNDNLVFVPTTPCRIIDTRISSGGSGPISAGTNRTFWVYNASAAFSWSSQGGVAGPANTSCPVTTLNSAGGTLGNVAPFAAVGTVTVVNPTAPGNFVIWGGNGAAPDSSALNWSTGQNLANTTVIPIGTRIFLINQDFRVQYNGAVGQADVVVDLVGYFVESAATALQCVTTGPSSTNLPVQGTTETEAFAPACPAGFTHVSVLCSSSSTTAIYLSKTGDSGDLSCSYINLNGVAQMGIVRSRCCRLSGQ